MLTRLLLLLALLAPLPAVAQDPAAVEAEDAEEGTACLLIATRWTGGAVPIRNIEAVPVPQGFRRLYESMDPCNSLQSESLIDWHLRFGSERSAVAALAYLERGRSRVIRSPEDHAAELESAWQAAQGDLARAREIQADSAPFYRFMRNSETLDRLVRLAHTSDSGYLFLAEQYLRVAEQHASLRLLEKAERFLATELANTAFLARFDAQPFEQGLLGRPAYLRHKADDIEMRAAVLRARLTRTEEAIARAEATLRAKERPEYRDLAEYAFTAGDDFCDMSVGADEALRHACRSSDEPNLQERMADYLVSRAVLDLVKDDTPAVENGGAFEAIMRFLAAERYFDSSRCCQGRSNGEVTVELSIALAEYHRRKDQTAEEIVDYDPLEALEAAEHLAPPYEYPNRFRRIARAWLARYRQAAAVLAADEGQRMGFDEQRHAAYLERTLANLDAIARSGRD